MQLTPSQLNSMTVITGENKQEVTRMQSVCEKEADKFKIFIILLFMLAV